MKLLLGFDLDGVLYNWLGACVQNLRVLGFDNIENEVDVYNLLISCPDVLAENIVNCTPYYYTIFPNRHDVEVVNYLADKYEIYYITARPIASYLGTLKWLKVGGFPCHKNLIVTNDKVSCIRKLGLKYYVEDRDSIVKQLVNITNVIRKVNFYSDKNITGVYKDIYNLEELKEIL